MDNTVFKIGDRVFHAWRGWGTIEALATNLSPKVCFDNDKGTHTHCDPRLLSFTEYNLKTGGFSQDRGALVVGKWCRVWDNKNSMNTTSRVNIDIVQEYKPNNKDSFITDLYCWPNAQPLEEETVVLLVEKGILPHGNNTGDNISS